jgi:transcriptional regulator with XRE-family HTH domain
MDSRSDVSEFLRSRRAKVTPEQVNLIVGSNRRVPGLRREEVATLASVSVDYYARLERGNLSGVSDEVLDSVAHALRLDEAETAYLFALARAAQPGPARRKRAAKAQELRAHSSRTGSRTRTTSSRSFVAPPAGSRTTAASRT